MLQLLALLNSVVFSQQPWRGSSTPEIDMTYMSTINADIVRVANSKAGIKPTAPLLAFDKENSIEFPLDFLHYLYKCLTLTLY